MAASALICWYLEKKYSVQTLGTIVEPKKRYGEFYNNGDVVKAKFQGVSYPALLVKIDDDRDGLIAEGKKLEKILSDHSGDILPEEIMMALKKNDQSSTCTGMNLVTTGTHGSNPSKTVTNGTHGSNPSKTVTTGTHGSKPSKTVTTGTHGSNPSKTDTTGTHGSKPSKPVTTGTHGSKPSKTVTTGTHGSKTVTTGTNGSKTVTTGTHGTNPSKTVTTGTNGSNPSKTVTTGTHGSNPSKTVTTGTHGSNPSKTVTTGTHGSNPSKTVTNGTPVHDSSIASLSVDDQPSTGSNLTTCTGAHESHSCTPVKSPSIASPSNDGLSSTISYSSKRKLERKVSYLEAEMRDLKNTVKTLKRKLSVLEEAKADEPQQSPLQIQNEMDDQTFEQLLKAVSHLGVSSETTCLRILALRVFSQQDLLTCTRTGKKTSNTGEQPKPRFDHGKLRLLERAFLCKFPEMTVAQFNKKFDNILKMERRSVKGN